MAQALGAMSMITAVQATQVLSDLCNGLGAENATLYRRAYDRTLLTVFTAGRAEPPPDVLGRPLDDDAAIVLDAGGACFAVATAPGREGQWVLAVRRWEPFSDRDARLVRAVLRGFAPAQP
jgi:hypothetical protein